MRGQSGSDHARGSALRTLVFISGLAAWSSTAGGEALVAAADCTSLDPALRRQAEAELKQRVARMVRDRRAIITVSFTCTALLPGAGSVIALRGHGHGSVVLMRLEPSSGLHAIRLETSARPVLGAERPPVGVAHRRLKRAELVRVFDWVRTTLAARVSVERPPPSGDTIELGNLVTTSNDELIEVRAIDAEAHSDGRRWQGYVNNLDEGERAALELGWEGLTKLLPKWSVEQRGDSETRSLLTEAWRTESERPGWTQDRLLELAASIGGPELIPTVGRELESPDERRRILAINALAQLTGKDLRRDAEGRVRPLPEVVADYKREVAAWRAE